MVSEDDFKDNAVDYQLFGEILFRVQLIRLIGINSTPKFSIECQQQLKLIKIKL